MDTTQIQELLTRLETADPADAPDVADAVAASLARSLDGEASAGPGTPEGISAETDDGGTS